MNGTGTVTPATFINRNVTIPPPQFLGDDELDAVWIAVRRQARRDAAVYDELARERSLDELAEGAIGNAMTRELGVPIALAAAQRRRLFFEYLEALLSHVPR